MRGTAGFSRLNWVSTLLFNIKAGAATLAIMDDCFIVRITSDGFGTYQVHLLIGQREGHYVPRDLGVVAK